ncbi:polymeric immunoglobulin receptor-like [Megalobrama amblycephala]|uniref:polymeric immunoglobulin receptor-like n=1 Tax=Megalobrama amblycephala TaxID=75352 RepID=UPI0020140EE8|nr:polymeric immunoglobulin receptor-like [Megalobrama amblycephala]
MRDHLYLFFFMIQFSTGCILSNERQTTRITGYTGGSVVLPCSCAHPQSTVNTFTWRFFGNGKQWIPVFEDEEYSGRRVLFNESSPQNLSLLISDLRQEDQGFYECKTEHDKITITIRLTVKGCNLVQSTEVTIAVTGYAGESVVLPCSCSELLAKPEQIRWMYYVGKAYKEIYPNEKTERHKNRVKLLNQTSPGNLSLYISALTAEDEGDYYCSVSSQKVSYRLYVEVTLGTEKPHIHTVTLGTEKPHIHTVTLGTEKPHIHTSISLSTLQPSHQTQELPPPQQPHNTSQYLFILVAVFPLALILPFLVLSSRYAKDEEACSAIVYVETAFPPDHTQNDAVELTECQYQS